MIYFIKVCQNKYKKNFIFSIKQQFNAFILNMPNLQKIALSNQISIRFTQKLSTTLLVPECGVFAFNIDKVFNSFIHIKLCFLE